MLLFFFQREEDLLKESHELREQNELLEFRIIELEESHDKVSSRIDGASSDGVPNANSNIFDVVSTSFERSPHVG